MAEIIDLKEWLSESVHDDAERLPLLERLECIRARLVADLETMITECDTVLAQLETSELINAVDTLEGFRVALEKASPISPKSTRAFTRILLSIEQIRSDVSKSIREQLDAMLFSGEGV